MKSWNKEVFGQLKQKIIDKEKQVLEAQSEYDSNPSDPLLLALNFSKASLHNWLKAESIHWKQKSKIRWLKDGDRNTKFFHLSAKSRSTINRIDKISVDGIIIEDAEQIRIEASSVFSNLIQSSPSVPR